MLLSWFHASLFLTVALLLAFFYVAPSHLQADEHASSSQPSSPIYLLQAQMLNGESITLGERYRDRVLLVVNVASRCGFTRQYAGLQQLHEEFAAEGLAIVGFPCNQFGEQEPGTSEDILAFCQKNYGVSFDLFTKIQVNGESAHPLYRYLTGDQAPIEDRGPIKWNFEKFLIDHRGQLLARYRSRVTPEAIRADIERALAQAPKKEPANGRQVPESPAAKE